MNIILLLVFGITDKEDIWILKTEKGKKLECADNHVVLTNFGWKMVKDIDASKTYVSTKTGWEKIISLKKTSKKEEMYDLLNVNTKSYFTNEILSHNSTTVRCVCFMICLL